MTQLIDEGFDKSEEAQVQDSQVDLKTHLSKHNVTDKVFKLLCKDSITIDELTTFTNEELKEWCNENSLKIIEKKRFVKAVKLLANSQANKTDNEAKIVSVFVGNEEKEQLTQFDNMKNNVKNMMNHIHQFGKKSNVDKIIKEINSVCDEIQSCVEKLRNNLLNQVRCITDRTCFCWCVS